MANKLKTYFPMIRTRTEVLGDITANRNLLTIFHNWDTEQQEEFLDFCTGVRGIRLLYDCFFKQVMNPETAPERLEELLSLILGESVKIVQVLSGESTNLADDGALLIMDVLVRFKDGRYCNVEIQKRGYAFPGQRTACYSADLLMRQYKAVRSRKKKKFTYQDIKDVFTIVLYDQSPADFWQFPDTYKHFFEQKSDTGLKMEHLQKYIYIPLDILRSIVQNKGIRNKLEAWLVFLCMDNPEIIETLITSYPEFKPMYEQAYDMCRNLEELMGIFSEELRILDRNTAQYMIDEMHAEINAAKNKLNNLNEQLNQKNEQLSQKDEQLNQKDEQLNQKDEQLNQKDRQIAELKRQLSEIQK